MYLVSSIFFVTSLTLRYSFTLTLLVLILITSYVMIQLC